jgi:hypothetical protein
MIRPTLFFALLIAFVACNSGTPTHPSQPSVVPGNDTITLGQALKDTYIGNPLIYQLTAPSGGTLVTQLTFDPTGEAGVKLMLTIDECAMPEPSSSRCRSDAQFLGSAPNWSPVVGRVAVSAGRTYRLIVEDGVAPWDLNTNYQPFVMIAAIE